MTKKASSKTKRPKKPGDAPRRFAVWAPNAQRVNVVGDFNGWDGSRHSMRRLDQSGVWEVFIPGLAAGELYKYEIHSPGLPVFLKADPYASYAEEPPNTSSVVYESKYRFRDAPWMRKRTTAEHFRRPLAIYEVHFGSWLISDRGGALQKKTIVR